MAFPGVFRSFSVFLVLVLSISSSVALPETGKWDFNMSPVRKILKVWIAYQNVVDLEFLRTDDGFLNVPL